MPSHPMSEPVATRSPETLASGSVNNLTCFDRSSANTWEPVENMQSVSDLRGMEDKNKGEGNEAVAVGLLGKVVEQYRKTREHAETYPYVWGSYILVYGGFGLWFTYRFRKLRKTEDRVRVLQAKLRKIFEEEEAAKSATSSGKLQKPPPSDKAPE